jgi:limonene-1,2-epoxide hydrolase
MNKTTRRLEIEARLFDAIEEWAAALLLEQREGARYVRAAFTDGHRIGADPATATAGRQNCLALLMAAAVSATANPARQAAVAAAVWAARWDEVTR